MILDTIAAISTAVGEGGIAVIRVSGVEAVPAVERMFRSKSKLGEVESHTVHYGRIVDPQTGEAIEEVLVTVMRGPRSFTAEDVVEISTHGGFISVKQVLDLVLRQPGLRAAEPGEFTRRAFLNGRIDLTQAEAVMDLIRAKSDRASAIALKQVDGRLARMIQGLRGELIELLAHIEVNIDYPEHDVEAMTADYIRTQCGKVISRVDELLRTANEGKILREGITTAIVGRPNVGKSSLLNALAQDNRAIVTDIPGTTRDVIEEYVTVGGIPLKLLDTAGIRETLDTVEQIGVARSRAAIVDADLILFVLSAGNALHEDERELLAQLRSRQCIVILNKSDLPRRLELEQVLEQMPEPQLVQMSVLQEQGLEQLGDAIRTIFFAGELESADLTYVSNARHIALLKQAKAAAADAIDAADAGIPIDLIQIDVRTAWERLGEINGENAGDSLIDQIFSQFCLGK
ncbi:tRNA uridine-5-carboxymethylaminomethyl(34) synthesis GTPase MnmE [Paenibacillus sp. IB182496]|uniref:tRNA modification GTPase MnmE n=1 Tax=Paenibacillus sabuli TaxID=2772509 RepID=A0A927BZ17_9BACL|nr:tRNA uridine-5-carboxymethylaminomethyl(34) synthesis GTPase MnmE [Paenibacillus sabuli]MBD2848019.1 tRNA uridine-5-carboxymethylaminomethyl(34) synthesis GTPase MnmE [Paenibacillus sabuli]